MRKMIMALSVSAATAWPPPSGSCTDPSYGPVLGGVDFVDLLESKTEGTDKPDFGTSDFTSTLNSYTFHFKSQDNKGKFDADPWKYAPAYGGF